VARMTSGASATNSAALRRMRSASAALQRVSIRTLRPSVHPNCCRPCTNAVMRLCDCGSSAASGVSTPIRRIRSPCCARAARGHVAVTPHRSVMNSRRLIGLPCHLLSRWEQHTTDVVATMRAMGAAAGACWSLIIRGPTRLHEAHEAHDAPRVSSASSVPFRTSRYRARACVHGPHVSELDGRVRGV
jgi:hypothetical protein